jgi:CPA1 family monovalent cation:H+ antiporter
LDAAGVHDSLREYEASFLRSIDFFDVLMKGTLSLLLFAGAWHVDLSQFNAYRGLVGGLALLGTVASTVRVVLGMWLAHRRTWSW